MTNEPSPLKDAIMDAVYVPLERDDMQTPCALPFMTSSEHGVCDGDGRPVSNESIASALNAVAKIQAEYYRVKKETQKETQKETTDEPSPRPWRVNGHTIEANDPEGLWLQNKKTGWGVVANLPSCPKSRMSKKNRETWDAIVEANAALIVAAVNEYSPIPKTEMLADAVSANIALVDERDRLRDIVRRLLPLAETTVENIHALGTARFPFLKQIKSDRLRGGINREVANAEHLLREASAAIGGEKQ